MASPALAGPSAHPTRSVCLTPPGIAMVWTGAGRPHETVAVPGVVLAPGEALVQIELSTVCASDVHAAQAQKASPLVLGHEYVGRIVDVADGVRAVDGGLVQIGDRIVGSATASCRECDRCRHGLPQRCRALVSYGRERIRAHWELTGGFATHAHLRAGTTIVRVGESLPSEVLAPAGCGAATAWAALARADDVVDVDDAAVLILGAGLIGLTACAMAGDRGARVVVADPDPARRELATRFGAAQVADPTGRRAVDAALDAIASAQFDVVIETSGSPHGVRAAMDAVGVAGVVVLVGGGSRPEPVPLDPERLAGGLATVRGLHGYAPRDLDGAIGYLRHRASAHPFVELVSARYPLAQADAALAAAATGKAVRVAIDPRDALRRR